jgi:hypothetical protein
MLRRPSAGVELAKAMMVEEADWPRAGRLRMKPCAAHENALAQELFVLRLLRSAAELEVEMVPQFRQARYG